MFVPAFTDVYTAARAGMKNAAGMYTGGNEVWRNLKYVGGNFSMLLDSKVQQKGIAGSVNPEAEDSSADLTSANAFLVLLVLLFLGNSCLQFGNNIMQFGYGIMQFGTVILQVVDGYVQHMVSLFKFVYTDLWIPVLWDGILRPCIGMIWNGVCVPFFLMIIYPALVDMKQLVQSLLTECWIFVKQCLVENVIDPLKTSCKDFVDMVYACIMSIFAAPVAAHGANRNAQE